MRLKALRHAFSELWSISRKPLHRFVVRVRAFVRFNRYRTLALIGASALGIALIGFGGLWLRLSIGPLTLDVFTPWLTSAIEERFGREHRVGVGGTQLERDETGRMSLRLRDIVVHDRDGAIVASAPKAEVGIAGASLFLGQIRPERLSFIGAEMAVRIEADGAMTFSAGPDQPTGSIKPLKRTTLAPSRANAADLPAPNPFTALLVWLDSLNAWGLDGHDLKEIGLKSGALVVDDRRNGKRLEFENINLSLTRPQEGGLALALSSDGTNGPWSMAATVTPRDGGARALEAVIRDVSPRDLLLAARFGDGRLEANLPLSAIVRAEIAADGALQSAEGRIVVSGGFIGQLDEPESRVAISDAQLSARWDHNNRVLLMPFELNAGPNRIQLLGQIEPPTDASGIWNFGIARGRFILASPAKAREAPLVLDRVSLRARLDPAKQKVELTQGDVTGLAAGLAISGGYDYSEAEPRLMVGIAGTRMNASALKRVWPAFFAPNLRAWVIDNVPSGTVERLTIATNAPISTLRPGGPPVPDDGLSIEMISSGAIIQPIGTLPPIRDADAVTRINGRHATVTIPRGTMELPSGRKLTLTNGVFEVGDTNVKPPVARTRFNIEGPVEAAAELLGMEPLRSGSVLPFDPSTSRGSVSAFASVSMPLQKNIGHGNVQYNIDADISNFSGEKLLRGHKVEAASIRVNATQQAVQFKGDVKIAGIPASVEYRRPQGSDLADVKFQGTLDDAARARLGLDFGSTLVGPVPLRLAGRIGDIKREGRLVIEADLNAAKVTDAFPGWNKAAGKPARASFVVVDRPQFMRLEDIVIEGSGALLKGTIELDSDGEISNLSFPTFGLSDGDRASLRLERGADRTKRIVLRGDVYDGRGFLKSLMSGSSNDPKSKQPVPDIDLDIKLGALTGHHGEAMRNFELRMARRAGQIRSLGLNAKLGRDVSIIGDMRTRGNAQVVYFETPDAGALLRFTDIYPRVQGGAMWVAMAPPGPDGAAQEGTLNLRDFSVRGEAALDRVAASSPGDVSERNGSRVVTGGGVAFSRMRVEFTRTPGKFMIRDGVVWGPQVGATVEGAIDYSRDDVRLRGTFVPAYAVNNMLARIPIVGLVLGGNANEGLLGVTFEVVGTPASPTLRVNPMSAIAPGFLRKIFEFRGAPESQASPLER